jgi:hypothetical protein
MRLIISITSLALFISVNANAAAPIITGGQGYSNYTGTGTPIFYGGMVGTPPTGDNVSTIDTCANNGAALKACNTASVYGSLALQVTATHTDDGNLLIGKADRTLVQPALPVNSNSASATWDNLCLNMTSTGTPTGSNCLGTLNTGTAQLKVYVDKNRNNIIDSDEEGADFQVKLVHLPDTTYDYYDGTQGGISDFTPYPGDEKVYIEDPVVPTGTLSMNWGSQATRVRVFSSINNMTEATPGSGLTPQDLTVVTNGLTLDNSVVDGLTNGQRTWFRIGIVDEGMNVSLLFPPATTDGCDTGGTASCKYAVTPDEVLGLLTNDVNCFVATAAYGSSLEPKINTFREFRFKRLLPYSWGRAFVKWYYHYGPYLARYIHDKPMMRAGARVILWPAYGFSRLALTFGIYPAMAFTLMLLSALVALPFLRARKID